MRQRMAVASLALSASAFLGLVLSEGFTSTAVIPTANDRPTVGHGSTFWENGTPVQMGDKITPTRALIVANVHISKDEAAFRASLPGVELHQAEYDVFVDWSYQYGTAAWEKSSMRRNLLARDYRAACASLLKYKFSGGYDCSIPGNKVCAGVWTRQIERYKKCMAAQ